MLRSPKPSKVTIPMIIMIQWIGEDPRNHGVLSHQMVLSSMFFLILGIFRSGSWAYSEWNSQCVDSFVRNSSQLFPLGHPTSMVSVAGSKSLKTLKRWSGVRVHSVSWLPVIQQQLKSERRSNNEGLTTGGCLIFSAGLGSKKNSQRI